MRILRQSRASWSWSIVEITLFVVVFACFLNTVHLQVCPANGILAGVDFKINDANYSAPSTDRYLLTGKGTVNCKGVIQEWTFHSLDSCNTASIIDFEVWRKTSPTTYQLVGINTYTAVCSTFSSTVPVTFGIGAVDQIPVEPGYVIGWRQLGTMGITVLTVGDSSSTYATMLNGPYTPGNDVPAAFSNVAGEDYSLKVKLKQGDYPTLDNLPAQIEILENVVNSFPIFTVQASHISNIHYKFAAYLAFSWSPGQSFYLANVSSISNGDMNVYCNASLDYEVQSVYQLSVTVTALGLSTTNILTVNVIDANEQHSITNLPAAITVPATSTATGDEVFLVLIKDPDLNPTVPVRFYLNNWSSTDTTSDVPPFVVDPDTGSVQANTDLKDWFLTNPASTYPASVTYVITILATDGLHPDSNTLTVTINQIKQPPVFLNLPSTISISENVAVTSIIFQVLLSPTTDTNISFQMFPLVPNFCLDQLSGVISVCSYAAFDFCTTSSYSIHIIAKNSALRSSEILTVNIQEFNTAPSFSQPIYRGSVEEKCPPGAGNCLIPLPVAASISVRDTNCLWAPSCSVLPGSGSSFFTTNCWEVNNDEAIDLDTNPQYDTITLVLRAQNYGFTSFAMVDVSVINTNDYAPNFSQPIYTASVPENAPGGTSVTTVSAYDLDRGTNGVFSYMILSSDPSYLNFQIGSQSGLISTKQPLDFESQTSYTLTVWAVDEGTHPGPLNGSAVVYISVIDANDNRPEINCSNRPSDEPYPAQPCFYNYDLKYDAIVGSNVSDSLMTASDVETASDKIIFEQLLEDSHFSFNESIGLITVAATLEAYEKYLLYVYANDNGSPSLRSRIANIRIDTYRPEKHWIDLTVRPEISTFDLHAFLYALRNITSPWFMKIVSTTNYEPNIQKDVIVTVYALNDTSTYQPENIGDEKVFVPKDELLKKLRKNIYGDPTEILRGPMFEGVFPVIKVMPTYMNWWLDTVEGIATMVCLTVIPLIIAGVILTAILKSQKLLCFKQTPSNNATKMANSKSSPQDLSQSSNQENIRYRSSHGRRASVETVHSSFNES